MTWGLRPLCPRKDEGHSQVQWRWNRSGFQKQTLRRNLWCKRLFRGHTHKGKGESRVGQRENSDHEAGPTNPQPTWQGVLRQGGPCAVSHLGPKWLGLGPWPSLVTRCGSPQGSRTSGRQVLKATWPSLTDHGAQLRHPWAPPAEADNPVKAEHFLLWNSSASKKRCSS